MNHYLRAQNDLTSVATLRADHLLGAFADHLNKLDRHNPSQSPNHDHQILIRRAHAYALGLSALEDHDNYNSERLLNYQARCLYLLEQLSDALQTHALPYTYHGASEGDGSCFGFFPDHHHIQDCLDNGELPSYHDLADVPEDIDTDYAVINDHGNITIYDCNENPFVSLV